MRTPTSERKEWVTSTIGARALGIAPSTFRKCAPRLMIRCREIPGRNGRLFNLPDIEQAIARMELAEAAQVAAARLGNETARTTTD